MKLSLLPVAHMFGRRMTGREPRPIESVATRTWEVAPGETAEVPSAFFLPGQLERITGWEFSRDHPARALVGGYTDQHAPTCGFVVPSVWLLDGVLYKGAACSHLRPRAHRIPRLRATEFFEHGALCCTPGGNRYFGSWLIDDCPLHALAASVGRPVTVDGPMSAHAQAYADLFGIAPTRAGAAFFRELVVFDDKGQNRHKGQRFMAMREKVRQRAPAPSHPGVFLLRGNAGQRRILHDELEIAEHLRERRGFRIVDPMRAGMDEILQACAGARVVAGIEGSAIAHGMVGLDAGAAVFTLQPPDRFVSIYKHVTDRDGQHFAFVVGRPESGGAFRIDVEEVERTLDLLP